MTVLSDIAVPGAIWLWGVLTLVLTAVVAFVAGIRFARASVRWTQERARQRLSMLVPLVVESLTAAEHLCRALAEIEGLRLSGLQFEQFATSRQRLAETLMRVDERQQCAEAALAEERAVRRAADEFAVSWTREPEDEPTRLPDRWAFDTNLTNLLAQGAESAVESGLLLVRIDRLDHLRSRFGPRGANQLVERMARLLCRTIRDKDLVCRFAEDSFAVLLPGVDSAAGGQLAQSLRTAIREHQFHLDAGGTEVFVTASFGYSGCLPGETAEQVVGRAVHALAKSERRGRNQLHIHDGSRVVHCAAV
jgi:two-component system, cell cycle response regulator